MIVFPFYNSVVYEVDIETGKVCRKFDFYFGEDFQFITNCTVMKENKILFVEGNSFLWYVYNLDMNDISSYEVCLSPDVVKKRYGKELEIQRKCKEYFFEGELTLEAYLNCDFKKKRNKQKDITQNILNSVQ